MNFVLLNQINMLGAGNASFLFIHILCLQKATLSKFLYLYKTRI